MVNKKNVDSNKLRFYCTILDTFERVQSRQFDFQCFFNQQFYYYFAIE